MKEIATTRIPKSIPTAHSLEGAERLRTRYTNEAGHLHYIVLGECTEARQTYYIGTASEARFLITVGFELAL